MSRPDIIIEKESPWFGDLFDSSQIVRSTQMYKVPSKGSCESSKYLWTIITSSCEFIEVPFKDFKIDVFLAGCLRGFDHGNYFKVVQEGTRSILYRQKHGKQKSMTSSDLLLKITFDCHRSTPKLPVRSHRSSEVYKMSTVNVNVA